MVPSVILIAVIVLIGTGLTTWMAPRLLLEERLAIGAVIGALAVSVTALAAFVVVGMGWGSLGIGLFVPGSAAVAGAQRRRERLRMEARTAWRRIRLPARRQSSLRPFLVFQVAAGIVTTRVLALSYQTTDEGVAAGSLAVWGDWSAHLTYAGSFAYGDNRGFDLPIASGHGFKYHFLVDFFGALFTVSGASLTQALVVSEWLLAIAFPALLWCAVMRLTRSRLTASITVLLFTLHGGVGVWYFLSDVRADGWSTVTALPRTYARIPEADIWVDNVISASLYAQRTTLLGLSAGAAALIVLLASRPGRQRAGFVWAGIIVGILGFGHGHTLLTALALGVFALAADRDRIWLWFLLPAAAIGLPLAVAILPETDSVRWMLGWMAPEAGQTWVWFWFRNVGVLLPLFAWLSLVGGGSPRLRRLTAPMWLWFIVPNLIVFHPWEWNNTKYFLYWQLAGSLLIASWVTRAVARARRHQGVPRIAVNAAVALVLLAAISAGTLDLIRATQRSSAIPWATTDDLEAAERLRHISEPDEIIVSGMNNSSAIATLSGRRALSGYPGWTFDLGLADWQDRRAAARATLNGSSAAAAAIAEYGVDYVVIGPAERAEHDASDAFWLEHGRLVVEVGEYRVYATSR